MRAEPGSTRKYAEQEKNDVAPGSKPLSFIRNGTTNMHNNEQIKAERQAGDPVRRPLSSGCRRY